MTSKLHDYGYAVNYMGSFASSGGAGSGVGSGNVA
jgi:hypothetical protein